MVTFTGDHDKSILKFPIPTGQRWCEERQGSWRWSKWSSITKFTGEVAIRHHYRRMDCFSSPHQSESWFLRLTACASQLSRFHTSFALWFGPSSPCQWSRNSLSSLFHFFFYYFSFQILVQHRFPPSQLLRRMTTVMILMYVPGRLDPASLTLRSSTLSKDAWARLRRSNVRIFHVALFDFHRFELETTFYIRGSPVSTCCEEDAKEGGEKSNRILWFASFRRETWYSWLSFFFFFTHTWGDVTVYTFLKRQEILAYEITSDFLILLVLEYDEGEQGAMPYCTHWIFVISLHSLIWSNLCLKS